MKDVIGAVVFVGSAAVIACLPAVLVLAMVSVLPPNAARIRADNARATIAAATAAVTDATAESELRALERAAATAAAAVNGGE